MNNSAFGTIAGLEGLHYTNEREHCRQHLGTEFKIRPAEMGNTMGGEGMFQQDGSLTALTGQQISTRLRHQGTQDCQRR